MCTSGTAWIKGWNGRLRTRSERHMFKRMRITYGKNAALFLALVTVSCCAVGGCGKKNDAPASDAASGPGAVSAPARIPAEAQTQINASQQRDAAERAAHAPKKP